MGRGLDPQDEAGADATMVDLLERAREPGDPDAVEHRMGQTRGAQGGGGEAAADGQQSRGDQQAATVAAHRNGNAAAQQGERHRHAERGFAVRPEIEHHARAARDRQPQEETALAPLGFERSAEVSGRMADKATAHGEPARLRRPDPCLAAGGGHAATTPYNVPRASCYCTAGRTKAPFAVARHFS